MQITYTLKVYPNGLGKSVYRILKISGSETLDELCRIILDSFDFDDDHLYEFCMDNKKVQHKQLSGKAGMGT